MIINKFKNQGELSVYLEEIFTGLQSLFQRPLRGFLPTGSSAEAVYALLRASPNKWKKQIQYIQIDEFQSPQRFFLKQIEESLLNPLDLRSQAEVIDPNWTPDEFQNHIQAVLNRRIDFALLGLGPNGHIGFHEPGPHGADFLGGLIKLTEESESRVKGAPGSWALTFGAGAFLRAREVILLACGAHKDAVYQQLLSSPPTADIPATLLKNHPNFRILTTLGTY